MASILPEDSGTIRCICGFDHDDNFTIQCERCNAWQHATCVNISDESSVPEHYLCPECNNNLHEFDFDKARLYQKQVKKRKLDYEKMISSPKTRVKKSETRPTSRSASFANHHQNLSFNTDFFNIPVKNNLLSPQAKLLWDLIDLPPNFSNNSMDLKTKVMRFDNFQMGVEAASLYLMQNVSANGLICEVKGQILTRQEYKQNKLNQFEQLRCPKNGVFFVPNLPFAFDTRKFGSTTLFVKRSDDPTAYLVPKIDKIGNLRLFLAARKSLKSNTEITLGYHFDNITEDTKWLLQKTNIQNCTTFDEEWAKVFTISVPCSAEKIRIDDVGEEIAEDAGVAPENAIWKSASECVAPPTKKRLSLADYRRSQQRALQGQ